MSRQIDADKLKADFIFFSNRYYSVQAIEWVIDEQPTVDAEPVRYGKWIIDRDEMVMHCDSCGWIYEYYDGLEEEWNYCPHCGALQSFAIATERKEDETD